MSKVELEELFFDFFDAAKQHIPDSDHITLCVEILRNLEDDGYNLDVLKGHDDIVDEAMEELFPEININDDEEENGDY